MSIARESDYGTYTLDSVLADTPTIEYRQWSGGAFIIPSGSPITALTYYGAEKPTGTFTPIHNSAGTAVTQTVAASQAHPIPDACFAYPFLKVTTNADGAVIFVGKT